MKNILSKAKALFIVWADKFLILPDDNVIDKHNCVAIVLPEGVTLDGEAASKQSRANANIALDLLERKIIHFIIVCGGNGVPGKLVESLLIKAYLLSRNKKIFFNIFEEPVSEDTFGNAYWGRHSLQAIVKLNDIRGIIVIAHKKQSSRAKLVFEQLLRKLEFKLPLYILSTDPEYGDNAQKGRFRDEFIFTFWNVIAYFITKVKTRFR